MALSPEVEPPAEAPPPFVAPPSLSDSLLELSLHAEAAHSNISALTLERLRFVVLISFLG